MCTEEKAKVIETRFGKLSTADENVITVRNGLLGFEEYREFFLISREEQKPFQWLISVDNPDINFIAVNPLLFFPDYAPNISKTDLKDLKIDEPSKVRVLTLVTTANPPEATTINLSGPIFINKSNNVGKQIALTGDAYSTKHNLFHSKSSQVKED